MPLDNPFAMVATTGSVGPYSGLLMTTVTCPGVTAPESLVPPGVCDMLHPVRSTSAPANSSTGQWSRHHGCQGVPYHRCRNCIRIRISFCHHAQLHNRQAWAEDPTSGRYTARGCSL